jgi:hypothetical protein
LIAVLLTSGCTETTAGTAGLAPNAGRVPAIKRVLFDGTALARLLGQPFQPYPHCTTAIDLTHALMDKLSARG